jgi:hypothetical protein
MRRHSRLRRFCSRLFFHLLKMPLAALSLAHHRPYMYLYTHLLRMFGMHLNGTPRYISITCYFDDLSKIEIGSRAVISTGVAFLTHDYSVTTALIARGSIPPRDIAVVRGIKVGSNVFIGRGSIIMPNCSIGDNVVVGAGSVVRGNIPAGSVVLGNPAQIIGDVYELGARASDTDYAESLRVD